MSHNEIYQMFTLYFPDYAKDRVKEWFPNGKAVSGSDRKMSRNLFSRILVKPTGGLKPLTVISRGFL